MEYLLIFLEGIASFISPCVLPMIPIYVAYFTGEKEKNLKKSVTNSIAFVLGFTIIFLILSVFASQLGGLISENMKYIKILFGILIIIFGLNYMEILKLKILNRSSNMNADTKNLNFLKSLLFGATFSISWTPCIGAFLSSALLLIARNQELAKGIFLILLYSIGLGIPFIISTILIEKIKGAFDFIKKNYNIIRKISGILLIVLGIYTIVF